ncbi:DNA gyrase inhibitor YacG [Ideonella sp. A 288]|uniref:DNA gyrase inhibitor YacG n=1 Tax=Ideonella sp. A 288 TaxID=1962181 RepID=UPI000B4BFDA8|nr:DNA gyrase inhibitor YacG [Ideonella sp. A 288]
MTDAPAPKAPMVPCPTCQTLTRFAPDNPWRPFCSQRCRSVDLGAWASERYRVAAKPPADEDDGPAN